MGSVCAQCCMAPSCDCDSASLALCCHLAPHPTHTLTLIAPHRDLTQILPFSRFPGCLLRLSHSIAFVKGSPAPACICMGGSQWGGPTGRVRRRILFPYITRPFLQAARDPESTGRWIYLCMVLSKISPNTWSQSRKPIMHWIARKTFLYMSFSLFSLLFHSPSHKKMRKKISWGVVEPNHTDSVVIAPASRLIFVAIKAAAFHLLPATLVLGLRPVSERRSFRVITYHHLHFLDFTVNVKEN